MPYWIAVTGVNYIRIHGLRDCARSEIRREPLGPYCCMPQAVIEALRRHSRITTVVVCKRETLRVTEREFNDTMEVLGKQGIQL